MENNNLLISDADKEATEENLSKGASNLNSLCYQDLLKLLGVDYIG